MRIILAITFLFFSIGLFAQSEPKSVKKRKEQLEKQEETKKRKGEKAHQKGIDKHMKIQTKETKKE